MRLATKAPARVYENLSDGSMGRTRQPRVFLSLASFDRLARRQGFVCFFYEARSSSNN